MAEQKYTLAIPVLRLPATPGDGTLPVTPPETTSSWVLIIIIGAVLVLSQGQPAPKKRGR